MQRPGDGAVATHALDVVPGAVVWQRWRRAAWGPGLSAAALTAYVLPPLQQQVLLVSVLVLGLFSASIMLICDDELRTGAVLAFLLWSWVGLGLAMWSTPVGLLVGLVVLATTPAAHRLTCPWCAAARRGRPLVRRSDRALLHEWALSSRALRWSAEDPDELVRVVGLRARLLDEITGRGLLERCR